MSKPAPDLRSKYEQERRERRKELIAELNKLDAKRLEQQRYTELARDNAQAAALFTELQTIDAA